MMPPYGRVESRCVKMFLEIEGQNVAWSCANVAYSGLLTEVETRGLSLLLARRDKRGEPGAREGRSWTPMCGHCGGGARHGANFFQLFARRR